MEDVDGIEKHQGQKSLSGLLQVLHHLQLHPNIRLDLPIPNPVSEVLTEEEIESELNDEREQTLLRQRLEPSILYPVHAPTDRPYAPTQNPFYDPEQARALTLLSTISTLLSTGVSGSHFSTTLYSLERHSLFIAKSTLITRSDEQWARKLHFLLTDQRPEPRRMRIENRLGYVEQEMFPWVLQRCCRAINKRIRGLREVLDLDFSKLKAAEGIGDLSALSWQKRDHLGWEVVRRSSVAIDWLTALRVSPHLKGCQIPEVFKVTHGYIGQWKLEVWQAEKFLLGVLFNMGILLNDLKFDAGTNADENKTPEDFDINPDRPWISKWSNLTDSERNCIRRFMGLIGYCQILHTSKLLQYLAWDPEDGQGSERWKDENGDQARKDVGGKAGDETVECQYPADNSTNIGNDLSPNSKSENRGKKRKHSSSPSPEQTKKSRRQYQERLRRELALKIRRRLWKLMVYIDEVFVLAYRVQQAYPDGQVPYYWIGEREGDVMENVPLEGEATAKTETQVTKRQGVCSSAELAVVDAFWTMQGALQKGSESLNRLQADGTLPLLREAHPGLFSNWSPVVPVPPDQIQLHPEIKLMLHLEVHPNCSTYRQEHPLDFRTPIGSSKRTCWCCAVWLCEFWVEGSDISHYSDGEEEEDPPGLLSTTPKCVVGEVRSRADWSWAFPDEKQWAPDGDELGDHGSDEWERRRIMHRVIQDTNEFTLEVVRERLRKIIGR
ncbi:hypothetical protein VKT23_018751 [Stygiomarasmius scandens]|uniref:Uncharacterized protein n=1 Tax=Marasmiellus scandens TaxID=2682957 RepID=A0ABR1ING5_9AGAR